MVKGHPEGWPRFEFGIHPWKGRRTQNCGAWRSGLENSEMPRFLPFCKVFPKFERLEMAYFSLSYQLNKQKDYKHLWAELERLNAHKAMRDYYLLDVDVETAVELNRHLRSEEHTSELQSR